MPVSYELISHAFHTFHGLKLLGTLASAAALMCQYLCFDSFSTAALAVPFEAVSFLAFTGAITVFVQD